MASLLDFVGRRPAAVLLAVALLSAAAVATVYDFGAGRPRIRVDASADRLLPEENEARAFYDHVQEVFGSDETLLLAVVADDVFTAQNLERIARLADRIGQLEGVHHVLSITNALDVRGVDDDIVIAPFVEEIPTDPAGLADLRARVLANPIYAGNLVSSDARAATLLVYFNDLSHADYQRSGLDDRIVEIAEAEKGDAVVWVTGGPHIRAVTARIFLGEAVTLPLFILAGLAVVLLFAFRTLHGVVLPLLTIVVAVTWTMAMVVLLGFELNAVTTLVPPLLTTLGLSYAVHVVSEVDQERRDLGENGRVPVTAALRSVALPVALTGVTTGIGFGSLLLSPLGAVREFGLLSLIGVACTVVASLTFTPAALALVRGKVRGDSDSRGLFARFVERVARFDLAYRYWIFAGAALIFVLSLYQLGSLRVGTEQISKFAADAPVRVHFEAVNEALEGANPLYVVLETDVPQGFMDPVNLREIEALQEWLEAQPEIGGTTSLADYIKLIHRGFNGNEPEFLRLPETKSMTSQLLLFAASDDLDSFVDGRYQTASIRVRARVVDSDEVMALAARIERRLTQLPSQLDASVTGTAIVLGGALDEIIRGQAVSMGMALIIIYCVLSLMFLSPRIGFIALIPNALPIVAYFGLLGLSGVSLNPGTSLVAPMVLGIAVDDTIHYFARFIRDAKRIGDERRATVSALIAVGRPVTYTSIALCLGFLTLNASEMRTQAELGNLAAAALAFAWLTDFLLTPALCARLRIATLWDLLSIDLGKDPQNALELLRGLSASQARIVATISTMLDVRAGERLFAAGEPGDALYVVVDGKLRAAVRTPEGTHELAVLERGATIGEIGLFDGQRSADVEGVDDSRLLRISQDAMKHMGRRYPRITSILQRNLNATLAARITGMMVRHYEGALGVADRAELESSGRALDDVFFREGAEPLRAQLREHEDVDAETPASDAPLEASLAQRLGGLGIRTETLAALTLIPLVEVAWADGRMDPDEREAVLAGAHAAGIDPGSPSDALLARWLDERPGPELLVAWRELIGAICSELSIEAKLRLRTAIVGRARDVAESAGGVLGFAAISRDEERVLEALGDAFGG